LGGEKPARRRRSQAAARTFGLSAGSKIGRWEAGETPALVRWLLTGSLCSSLILSGTVEGDIGDTEPALKVDFSTFTRKRRLAPVPLLHLVYMSKRILGNLNGKPVYKLDKQGVSTELTVVPVRQW